jgi:hypothetical protein
VGKESDVMADVTFLGAQPWNNDVFYTEFSVGKDFIFDGGTAFTYNPINDSVHTFVNEFADDGSADGAYAFLTSFSTPTNSAFGGSRDLDVHFDISAAFFEKHVGTTISFEFVVNADDPNSGKPRCPGDFPVYLKIVAEQSGQSIYECIGGG